jgi:alpha-pyrone synthase
MKASIKPAIIAIGTANPQYVQQQSYVADLVASSLHLKFGKKRLLKSIYNASGIEKRYSVLTDYAKKLGEFEFFPNHPDEPFPSTGARMQIYRDNARDLAIAAIKNCIAQLENFDTNAITHLITVSCTGMYAPGIDIELVQKLNFNSSTFRTAINFMGCYGAFNAIKIAESICKAEPNATVLIVSVELCTIHFQKNVELDNIISNAIFADGAAAVIIKANPEQQKYFTLETFHNNLLPQTNQEMAWEIGDNGFDIVLSTYIPEIIESGIAAFATDLLTKHGVALADIDLFAIHPGGLKILQACEAALKITSEQNKYSYEVLRNFGNMSSATILFVLKAIWDDLDTEDHHKSIFSCAFGPGLTLESMMLKTHVATSQ